MTKTLISDFSNVILFPKNPEYKSGLNELHQQLRHAPDYNPLDYFQINIEILDFYTSLKSKLDLYIFTSGYIQEAPELLPFIQPVFKKIFSAAELGISKKDPSAYTKLTTLLNIKPEETLFIDDSQAFIEAAQIAGLVTIHYTNNTDLFYQINQLIDA